MKITIPTSNSEQRFMKFHVWIVIEKYLSKSFYSLNKQIYERTKRLKKWKHK